MARPFVPIALTTFGFLSESKNEPAGRLKRGTIVAAASVASEVELDLSSLLAAGLVSVIIVVGIVVAVAGALDVAASDSVTVTVNTGMVVLMTDVTATGPPD